MNTITTTTKSKKMFMVQSISTASCESNFVGFLNYCIRAGQNQFAW